LSTERACLASVGVVSGAAEGPLDWLGPRERLVLSWDVGPGAGLWLVLGREGLVKDDGIC
jgi:hypothetical protein